MVSYLWFVTELKLTGCDKDIFSIIYGFNVDSDTEFKGSLSYLEKWTGASRRTVQRSIGKLIELHYIKKRQEIINGVAFPRYSIDVDGVGKAREKAHCTNDTPRAKMTTPPMVKMTTPRAEMTPNNIVDNIDIDNIDTNTPPVYDSRNKDESSFLSHKLPPKVDRDSKAKKEQTSFYQLVESETHTELTSALEIGKVDTAIKDFIDMRKLIKKPASEKALRLAIRKAWELSDSSIDRLIRIFEQSTMNSWQGVYPLDDRKPQRKKETCGQYDEAEIERMVREEGLYIC